jgi:hypothetical protein
MSEDNRKFDLDSEFQQLPARRDVALGLLGGAALLSGCVPEANALTGANLTWVDAIGTAPVTGTNLNLRGKVGSNSAALIVVLGYAKRGDGGGGLFSWMTTNAIDNGGTIIVANRSLGSQTAGPHWKRIYSGAIDPRWFGAIGNGIADDAGALAEAAAAIAAGGTIAFSPGQYKLSSSITFGEAISLEFTGGALLAPPRGRRSPFSVPFAPPTPVRYSPRAQGQSALAPRSPGPEEEIRSSSTSTSNGGAPRATYTPDRSRQIPTPRRRFKRHSTPTSRCLYRRGILHHRNYAEGERAKPRRHWHRPASAS